MTEFVPADTLRARFSAAMSAMYREEVPLYADLLAIVADVNARSEADLASSDAARMAQERHGAIRVGTGAELAQMRRLFAVMGMEPVGYYDLGAAGLPVHSTAFRPVTAAALAANPFRVFCSLLRLDLIDEADLRDTAAKALASRRICSERLLDLMAMAEERGGLGEEDAAAFLAEALEVFRWHAEAQVAGADYARLHARHPLIADIVSFKGPHINHLTPRTVDIDAAQAEMIARGIDAKDRIEGPPRRKCPILLRQTSFKALSETIRFADGTGGAHTARFGEIEQRGAALTPGGRELYDRCLAEAMAAGGDYEAALVAAFAPFPDDWDAMREAGLAWFRDTPNGFEPLVWEDFLPVSAAGIFRSNLGDEAGEADASGGSQAEFEQALGAPVADMFALYAAQADQPVAA
ncbi:VOC family protein [Croceicoccus sp. BE223]|uniref:VOC family protein n=1 Tax=Croceicoccus sp. BE223 TaxID=2817716 RepID=UPI0028646255|nr:VOC family protein [Croceicoccus sp. BE223]MDR7103252.1 putative glyoxalase superfamily metalloenzyme YdcJ [Croceicoccus sp. BE223]